MSENANDLKLINQVAIIRAIVEKSKNCGMVWNQLSVSTYQTHIDNFVFTLSKVSSGISILDVKKSGQYYRSYSSSAIGEIEELYQIIDALYAQADKRSRLTRLTQTLGDIHGCTVVPLPNITMSGGITGGGSTFLLSGSATTSIFLPTSLAFGPTPFPWVGTVDDINDSPDADSNDGDASYLRQEVTGLPPTNWGYVYFGFDLTSLPTLSPYSFNLKVACRRETELGVSLIPEVIVNSAVIYSDSTNPTDSYTVFESGLTPMTDVTSIDDFQVRLSMFTNVGDPAIRALRISAVSVEITGYEPA